MKWIDSMIYCSSMISSFINQILWLHKLYIMYAYDWKISKVNTSSKLRFFQKFYLKLINRMCLRMNYFIFSNSHHLICTGTYYNDYNCICCKIHSEIVVVVFAIAVAFEAPMIVKTVIANPMRIPFLNFLVQLFSVEGDGYWHFWP